MGRIRKANEDAILKTTEFLKELKLQLTEKQSWFTGFSDLQEEHKISKSTFSICKKLGIVEDKDGTFIWSKGEPSREMALLILEKLRVRQQKTAEPVKLPGFEDNIARIESLLTEIRDNAKVQQSLSNGLKIRDKPQSLFVEQETKEATRIKIACAIATGVYSVCEIKYLMQGQATDCNDVVIAATEDLLNKLYSK